MCKCKLKQNICNLFSNSFFWKLTAKLVRSVRQLAAKCAHAWRPSLVFLQFHIRICLDFSCIFAFSLLPSLVSISPRHCDQCSGGNMSGGHFSPQLFVFLQFRIHICCHFLCVFVQKVRSLWWLHVLRSLLSLRA